MNESDVFDAIYARANWIVAGPKSISGRGGLVEYSYSMSRSSICIRRGRWTRIDNEDGMKIFRKFCETLSGRCCDNVSTDVDERIDNFV